ncbi:hypothetical protein FRC10_008779 [Ceratobasidium sp. 414]|nr:hypothetical protein FRC10_008779 [Ceratobasidium sp. 414]
MPSLPIPSFLPQHGHLAESFPSSEEEHTDQWISVSRAPLLGGGRRTRTNSAGTFSENWHSDSRQDPSLFFAAVAQSSPVRPRLDFEIEPEAESASWARNVESRLAGLAPTTPKRNTRSRSVDELGMYTTSVKRRVSQVHERSCSQADLIVRAPKASKQEKEKSEKLQSIPSRNSITRRASAPLLGSSGSKKRLKPIDTTSRPYIHSRITPPGTAKPVAPVGQLSTFGTVYVPTWGNPRAEQISRPSTAPLPAFDFGFRDLAPTSPETDEELGGVYYSTYGSRASQIYEDNPFSDVPPMSTPFASAAVLIPASLLAEPTEKGHKRARSQPLVLAAALLRKAGREGSVPSSPATPSAFENRPRKATLTSLAGSGPGIPQEDSGTRPVTPAIPDFLVASRSVADGAETSTEEGEPRAASPKPKLKTRASLLSVTALASRQHLGSATDTSAGHTSDSPVSPPQARPRHPTSSPPNPRPRSALMRLAARFMPTEQGYAAAPVDDSFATVDESSTSADGMLSDPDENAGDGKNFLGELEIGQSTPIVEFGALPTFTEPPTKSPPTSPTYTRSRTWSKLSATSRRVFEGPLSATFGGRSRRQSVFSTTSSKRFDEFGSPGKGRSRLESLTRRPSADVLSAEGAIEGTVMYGVGEEMLRLMFGGAAPAPAPGVANEHPVQARSPLSKPARDLPPSTPQAPEPRERTRSLPRRVSAPRGDLIMLFTPPPDVSSEHEATAPVDIGLLPDFGGSLDLRFSNPAPAASGMTASAPSSRAVPRRKGHRRGMSSKENERVGVKPRTKSRSRAKSAPLGLSAELQKSLGEPIKPGILMNGSTNTSTPSRVVIVNSATTPSSDGTPRTRLTTRSNPMPVHSGAGGEGGDSADTSLSGTHSQLHPGVVITAPTPPAPRRSLSMPLDGSPRTSGAHADTARSSMSRGTSVQFVPESLEGPRRVRRKEISAASSAGEVESGNGNGNGKGKRKVEREGTDAADPGRSSPSKKPRLGGEEVDIIFMGEPLFGGVPQAKRGRGSVDRASSHSVRTHHPTPRYPHPNPYSKSPSPNPTPDELPDPERASIPMRAIVTPRVQSLYGAPPASDFVVRRQSAGDIPRPKSRASARSIPRPKSQASARSYATGGAKSNMTSARSHITGARSNVTGARSNASRATTQMKLKDRLPLQGWCFVLGFFMPFIWWYAAFSRAERGYYGGGVWSRDVEAQWEGVKTRKRDDRDNGRVVIYIPVIVLAAVFAR